MMSGKVGGTISLVRSRALAKLSLRLFELIRRDLRSPANGRPMCSKSLAQTRRRD